MAIVPIAEGPLVKATPLDTTAIKPVDGGGVAQGLASGLESAGKSLDVAAEYQQRTDALLDEAAVKQLDNQYLDTSIQAKTRYLGLTGSAALNARKDVENQLRTTSSDLMAQATTPRQKRMLGDILDRRLAGDMGDIAQHWTSENKTYANDESIGRQALAASAAGQSALNPDEAERNIATARAEVQAQAELNGWAPDYAEAKEQQAVSGIRRQIATTITYAGENGPRDAMAYLDKFHDQMTPQDALAVQDHVRARQSSLDAQARMAEAQAQRAANQAKSEARAKAEYGLFQIENGTTDDQTVAETMTAARDSGDALLVAKADKALTIAKTRKVYDGATPAELLDHINGLAAKVKAAGDSPNEGDVVALNTLQSMYGQSQKQLNSDPLSWAAQHLGVPVAPINWSDPASITARVHAGNLVASSTGAKPQYLTSAEAAQMAPIAAAGTAEQKRGMVFELARLGPAAGTAAARQVAPNDPAFWNLVGLATVPEPNVAAGLVSSTLAGPDAKKAYPALVNKQAMDLAFAALTGDAFRLMPDAAKGVRMTAENYSAGKQAHQGVHTFDPSQWPNAINSALGAYRDAQGIIRGGLAKHNGAVTVLPEGVSQAEFETKIAKAGVHSFDVADNGLPIWANGAPLTLGDMKKAQLTPVGNGRYALFLNNSYVQRKGGGMYILDYARMP